MRKLKPEERAALFLFVHSGKFPVWDENAGKNQVKVFAALAGESEEWAEQALSDAVAVGFAEPPENESSE